MWKVIDYLCERFDLHHLIIVLGALLGSIKTSQTINQNRHLCEKWLDIMLGLFCGVMVGHYFTQGINLYITGLLALIGGVAGAIVIEVLIELLPKLSRSYIINFFKKSKD